MTTYNCRVCQTKESSLFRECSTRICRECDNARARAERARQLADSIQTIDVVIPIAPAVSTRDGYRLFAALCQRSDDLHDNGAVGILAEGSQVRMRLFAGRMPDWMTSPSMRWEPLQIARLGSLFRATIRIGDTIHELGEPSVERLQPTRVLRMLSIQRHGKARQTDIVRRRLLAGGVLCLVARDGQEFMAQTGHGAVQRDGDAVATPLKILCASERDGLVAQMMPIGTSCRVGGGWCVGVGETHSVEISTTGLLGLRQAARELGVDGNTIQFWMRKLGYPWIHVGHGRYFDAEIMRRLREIIPSQRWRVGAPNTRQLWTEAEENLLWGAIVGRESWADVAEKVGRSKRACWLKARHLRRYAAELQAAE
jgi:hypothetical protein